MHIVTSRHADDDIRSIVNLFGEHSQALAHAFVDDLAGLKDALAVGSGIFRAGRRYDYLLAGVRYLPFSRYPFLAFFLLEENERLVIVRVLHERTRILPPQVLPLRRNLM